MSRVISDNDASAYSKATGLPDKDAREVLMTLKPELRKRVLLAARSKARRDDLLHDPLEDDPTTRTLVRQAAAKADRAVTDQGLGRCHSVWKEQARILWKDHKIRWYSPAEMNPFVLFD
jgi:hypothetical protein